MWDINRREDCERHKRNRQTTHKSRVLNNRIINIKLEALLFRQQISSGQEMKAFDWKAKKMATVKIFHGNEEFPLYD